MPEKCVGANAKPHSSANWAETGRPSAGREVQEDCGDAKDDGRWASQEDLVQTKLTLDTAYSIIQLGLVNFRHAVFDSVDELWDIRSSVIALGNRPKNVTMPQILKIVWQLQLHGFEVRVRDATHGKLITVNNHRCMVCTHHAGSKQVKPCYVRHFIDMMTEIGLYEER